MKPFKCKGENRLNIPVIPVLQHHVQRKCWITQSGLEHTLSNILHRRLDCFSRCPPVGLRDQIVFAKFSGSAVFFEGFDIVETVISNTIYSTKDFHVVHLERLNQRTSQKRFDAPSGEYGERQLLSASKKFPPIR